MSETKFTPGPWLFAHHNTPDGDDYHIIGVLRDDDTGSVFGNHPSGRYMSVSGCIDKYDAALIAAAPDLYEALSEALHVLSWEYIGTYDMDDPNWYDAIDKAKVSAVAALKKARGET